MKVAIYAGYSTRKSVYGYKSHPVGQLKLKKGQPRYEGMIHKIYEEEASVVRRIYKEFIGGKSINAIAQSLSEEEVPARKSGDWNTSMIRRILKNEKYTGLWTWRKFRNVRNSVTGKRKQHCRPEKEQIISFKEELVIISKKTWDMAQKRWLELNKA
jgi:hypothetical protein